MLDRELAQEATFLITTAIGEIMEDGEPGAVSKPKGGLEGFGFLAASLEQDGRDIAVLAAAVAVLVRRGAPAI